MVNRFHSPLRYPGGKAKLAPFVKAIFYENNLIGCDYVEPFAGGAGVALSLLFEKYASTITINDFDRSIYAFWHSVKYENERFCHQIEEASLDIETRKRQRSVQSNKQKEELFDLGFSTFYLNRTNISGVIKGGVIGGLNQLGKYKINSRFNKADLIRRIKKIGIYKNRIEISNKNALDLLNDDAKNKFVYLDPPYVKKAKGLYMNFYNEDDHNKIAQLLLSKNDFYWLLSYDKDKLIEGLYKNCRQKGSWNIGYGSSNRKDEELLFASERLRLRESKKVILQ